jgi:hypothetical protein
MVAVRKYEVGVQAGGTLMDRSDKVAIRLDHRIEPLRADVDAQRSRDHGSSALQGTAIVPFDPV